MLPFNKEAAEATAKIPYQPWVQYPLPDNIWLYTATVFDGTQITPENGLDKLPTYRACPSDVLIRGGGPRSRFILANTLSSQKQKSPEPGGSRLCGEVWSASLKRGNALNEWLRVGRWRWFLPFRPLAHCAAAGRNLRLRFRRRHLLQALRHLQRRVLPCRTCGRGLRLVRGTGRI